MKKTILFAAVAAMMGFTSCQDEVDMFENAGKTARINLNITNDDAMVTRDAANVLDASNWYITVGSNSQIKVSELGSKKYEAGTYNIAVSNYASEDEAIRENKAYYTGKLTNQTLAKGNNDITVDCGKAQNCRVKADFTGLADFATITDPKLTVTQSSLTPRELSGENLVGYFYAGSDKTISYTFDYKYNGTNMSALNGSITAPAAATEYQIKVVTNTNGTITLTITYDTDFSETAEKTWTIDAATGEKAE